MRKIIVAIPLVLSLMACGDQAQDFDATGTFERCRHSWLAN